MKNIQNMIYKLKHKTSTLNSDVFLSKHLIIKKKKQKPTSALQYLQGWN